MSGRNRGAMFCEDEFGTNIFESVAAVETLADYFSLLVKSRNILCLRISINAVSCIPASRHDFNTLKPKSIPS